MNLPIKRLAFALQFLVVLAIPVHAQLLPEPSEPPPPPPVLSLEQLADMASFVGVVRVLDTDYEYARKFPIGGTAFLETMIPYKLTRQREDIVEVYDEGLHDHTCYFENPTVFDEGRRHLVFFRDNPDVEGQYLGLPGGCALEILVSEDNRYALRYPPKGITLANDLSPLARPMNFADAYAIVESDNIDARERQALEDEGMLVRLEDGRYRFTHGIPLSEIRPLLGGQNLTKKRELTR